ncbi:uncharacterized protein LOC134225675 [Armigeres subalbatus]|uniref:uncharacterized protein LOC134225675 n=1 Tax=Armigeres subalbatus TaxID=124917 RepID=UPI002ED20A53
MERFFFRRQLYGFPDANASIERSGPVIVNGWTFIRPWMYCDGVNWIASSLLLLVPIESQSWSSRTNHSDCYCSYLLQLINGISVGIPSSSFDRPEQKDAVNILRSSLETRAENLYFICTLR